MMFEWFLAGQKNIFPYSLLADAVVGGAPRKKKIEIKNHRSKTTFQIFKQIYGDCQKIIKDSLLLSFFFSSNKLTRMKMDETMPRKKNKDVTRKFRFQSKNV